MKHFQLPCGCNPDEKQFCKKAEEIRKEYIEARREWRDFRKANPSIDSSSSWTGRGLEQQLNYELAAQAWGRHFALPAEALVESAEEFPFERVKLCHSGN